MNSATLLTLITSLVCCAGCHDEPQPSSAAGAVAPITYMLREHGQPGLVLHIAEVTTVERKISVEGGLELVQDIEVGKRIRREVVQIDPEGRITRYRKSFESFRQDISYRLADGPVQREALIHPLEGQTLDYIWRGTAWEVRPTGDKPLTAELIPGAWKSATHPLLPPGLVAQGDVWHGTELPFTLPDFEATPHVTFTLTTVVSEGKKSMARVDFSSELGGRGTLSGNYSFRLDEGRFVRIQLEARFKAKDNAEVQITTFRAFGSE